MAMNYISVVVLNWNGVDLLKRFVPSLVNNTTCSDVEIVVADNGSTDGSVEFIKEHYPEIKVLELGKNWGFAEGYNRAIAMLDSKYVLLLNSDVDVTPNWLQPLREAMDNNPRLGAVQPKLMSLCEPDKFEYAGACGGYIDKFGYPFCRGRILGNLEVDNGQYDTVQPVFWCTGAAIMVQRELYCKAGGLDPLFFAHMEEIDLCWRIARLGYELAAIPDSVVYHLGGGTLPMNHPKKLKLNYRNNLLMLYKNLSGARFCRVMSVRFFMDVASLIIFLLKFEFGNVASVYNAYAEFFKMKCNYKHADKDEECGLVYPGSIVWESYINRVSTFKNLKYKLCKGKFVK